MVEIELIEQREQSSEHELRSSLEDSSILEGIEYDLIKEVRELLKVEVEKGGAEKYAQRHYEDLMDAESPFTCWRYLTYCNRQPNEAFELMKSALMWRKENDIDDISNQELVKEFWHYAPAAFVGSTKDGYDVLFVTGRNYRKPEPALKSTIRKFITNALFGWDQKHRQDLNQFCIVFDVSDTGYRNIDLDFMSWLVPVKDFIPSRIHEVYVVGIPLIVRPLVRLIISWLPENFRKIVHCGSFEQLVEGNIDQENLPLEAGGSHDESYRLAPVDVPWAADSPVFSDPKMQKAIEDAIGFSVNAERRDKLYALQLEYENKILKN